MLWASCSFNLGVGVDDNSGKCFLYFPMKIYCIIKVPYRVVHKGRNFPQSIGNIRNRKKAALSHMFKIMWFYNMF